MRRLACLASAIAGLLAVGLDAGQRDRQMGGVGITVYADREYRGRNATFRDAVENLEGYDLNDRISSLQVAPGETWEVCEHASFQGRCQVFSGSEPNLSDRRWNDTISSMRRVRGGGGWPGGAGPGGGFGGIELFDREDYRGERRAFSREVSNLQLEGFNDQARSLRLPRSQTWEVCVDANYRNCRVVNSDWPELDRLGMDRKISSLRPWRQGGGGGLPPGGGYGRLILFEDPYFRGRSYTIQGADANIGGGQRVESAQVAGASWELCDRPRFGGRCVTITDSVPDLSAAGLRGRVRSARPLATPF